MNNFMNLNKIHIETERLLIRNLLDSDQTAYYNIFGNPNIALYDDFSPITKEDAVQNINDIKANYVNGNHEQEFAVALLSQNNTIGVLYMRNETNRILIGYHFNEDYHGKGYAIEAVRAYINWISGNSSKKIEALVDHNNQPSLKLLKKLGFIFLEQTGDELVFELTNSFKTKTDHLLIEECNSLS